MAVINGLAITVGSIPIFFAPIGRMQPIILEKITAIIQEKLTASQMLIRSKDRLLEHSSTISDDLYGKVMNELYISKWYEMSLIDKEEVPGENISLQNYNHYIPSYERYELNDRGIKYIQMLEIETKK